MSAFGSVVSWFDFSPGNKSGHYRRFYYGGLALALQGNLIPETPFPMAVQNSSLSSDSAAAMGDGWCRVGVGWR
jgi:hypothetical protein